MITFRLDGKSGVPIYRQIQDQIRFGIASGLLLPRDKLPTMRAVAVDLKINLNTVIKAYSELEREGLLTTEQGKGTFVSAQRVAVSVAERESKLSSLCGEFLARAAEYGFSPAEVVRTIQDMLESGETK